jgi:hypothetical protein
MCELFFCAVAKQAGNFRTAAKKRVFKALKRKVFIVGMGSALIKDR